MVGIVSSYYGLFDASRPATGDSSTGQTQGQTFVNVARGNLVLQYVDEQLSGSGADLSHRRFNLGTYGGQFGDLDNDGWTDGVKRISYYSSGSGYLRLALSDGSYDYAYPDGSNTYTFKKGSGAYDKIVRNGSEWIWTDGDTGNVEYIDYYTGNIKRSRDTSGNGFDYTYYPTSSSAPYAGRLSQVRDIVTGQIMQYNYNNDGKLAALGTRPSATGTYSAQVNYTYDSNGRLETVKHYIDEGNTTGATYTTTYAYEGTSKRVTKITQSDGTVVDITYHSDGKVQTITDQNGTTTFGYNTSTRETTVTNGNGDVTTYTYDSANQLKKVEHAPISGVTQSVSYGYDSSGNITSITDGKGNITQRLYDGNGNMTRERDGEGNMLVRTFDGYNNLLTETRYTVTSTSIGSIPSSAYAKTTRYVYDINGSTNTRNIRFTVSAEGRVSELKYDSRGRVSYSINYVGAQYDVSSLGTSSSIIESTMESWVNGLTSDVKSQNEVTYFSYDGLGNLYQKIEYGQANTSGTGLSDNSRKTTRFSYDEHGQLLQTINYTANGSTTLESYTYDGIGRIITQVDGSVTTTTNYNDTTGTSGRTVVSTSSTGVTVSTSYDNRGRMSSLTQSGEGQNRVSDYFYDASGRLFKAVDAAGNASFTYYNRASQVEYTVDAQGAVKKFVYDANGQIAEEIAYATPINTSTLTSTSAIGSLVSTSSANDRQTRYTYDDAGRLLTTAVEFGYYDLTATNTYNAASELVKTTNHSRVTRHFYDNDGLLIATLNAEGYLTENEYDGAGRLVKTIRYETKVTSVTDATSLSSIRTDADNGVYGQELYTYFYYDAQGRQTGVLNEQGYLTETVYEPHLQRTRTITYKTPVTTVYAWETLEDLRVRADNDGSISSSQHFDNLGRLSQTINADGTSTQYIYDSNDRLVRTIDKVATQSDSVEMPFENEGLWNNTGSYDWLFKEGGTPSGGTGPSSGDGKYIYLETSGGYAYGAGNTGTIESQTFNNDRQQLTFQYHMYGSDMGTLYVDIYHEGSWKNVWSIAGQQHTSNSAAWSEQTLNLSAYEGEVKIRFRGVANGGYRGDMAIDNVRIGQAYEERVTHTQYNAFGEITGTVSGEGAATLYQTTLQTQNFETTSWANTGDFAWTRDASGTPSGSTGPSRGANGTTYYTYLETSSGSAYNAGDTAMLESGTFDGTDARIEFSYHMYGDDIGTLALDVYHNGEWHNGVWNADSERQDIQGDEWSRQTVDLSDFAGSIKVRFRGVADGYYRGDIALDEIVISKAYSGSAASYNPSSSNVTQAIDKFGKRFEYDALGRKTAEFGADRQRTYFFYDGNGQLTYTANAYGEVAQTTYTAFGQVESTRVFATRLTSSELNSITSSGGGADSLISGFVNTSTDDTVIQYTYDRAGNVDTTTDARGFVTDNRYDRYGQLDYQSQEISNSQSTATWFFYDNLGQQTERRIYDFEDSQFVSAHTSYDGFGRVDTTTDMLGNVTDTDYLSNGRTIRVTDATNSHTLSTFDALGRVVTTTDNYGNATQYSYNEADNSVTITQPEGTQITTWTNQDGETLAVKDGKGNTTRYTYNKDGSLDTVVDAQGNVLTKNQYDASKRLIDTRDANGNHIVYSYDKAGRQLYRTVDPTGANERTYYQYDGKGQQLRVTEGYGTPEPNVTEYKYYADGKIKQVIVDPGGLNLSTQYTYDGLGNTLTIDKGTVANPTHATTEYRYDSRGRKISEIRDPDGINLETQYAYDENNNLTRTRHSNGSYTWYQYDDANRLTKTINALGEVSENLYDSVGRVWKTIRYANRFSNVGNISLNTSGEVVGFSSVSASSKDQETITVFDKDSRAAYTLSRKDSLYWAVTRQEYDNAGNIITKINYASYLPNYEVASLDNDNRITIAEMEGEGFTRTQTNAQVTHLIYDSLNRLRFTIDPENNVNETVYDAVGNKTHTRRFRESYNYVYYAESYLAGWASNQEVTKQAYFVYDGANRLTHSVTGQGAITESFYNGLGQIWKTINYYNRDTSVSLDSDNRVTGLNIYANDQYDQRTLRAFDKAGREIYTLTDAGAIGSSSSDPESWVVTQNVFDDLGNIIEARRYKELLTNSNIQDDGFISSYDLSSRGFGSANADTQVTRYTYDDLGRLRHTINAEGYVIESRYDTLGQLQDQTQFASDYTGSSFTEASLKTWSDANRSHGDNRATSFQYDNLGRQVAELSSRFDGAYLSGTTFQNYRLKVATVYNALGQVESRTEGILVNTSNNDIHTDARTTEYEYDNLGRQIKTTLPGYYNPTSGTVTKSAENSQSYKRTTEVTYDAFGNAVRNRIKIGSNSYAYQYNVYDDSGRHIYEIDAMGFVTEYRYNQDAETYNGAYAIHTVRYAESIGTPSGGGYWLADDVANELNGVASRTIITEYDKENRKVRVLMPSVDHYSAQYGDLESPDTISTGSDRPETMYFYDAFGNQTSKQVKLRSGGTASWTYSRTYYDKMGRATALFNQNYDFATNTYYNYVTTKEYDAFSNVKRTVEYDDKVAYSSLSTIPTSLSEKDRVTHYVYDKMGRLTHTYKDNIDYSVLNSSTQQWQSVNNADDVLVSQTSYNAFGQAEEIKSINAQTGALTNTSTLEYNALGQLTESEAASRSVANKNNDDPFNTPANAKPITSYAYDLYGNVIEERTYSSNSSARGLDRTIRHSYDLVGNEITTTDGNNQTVTYGYDLSGRVISQRQHIAIDSHVGNWAYEHDIERFYTYDLIGRQLATVDAYDSDPTDSTNVNNRITGEYSEYNAYGEVTAKKKIWGNLNDNVTTLANTRSNYAKVAEYTYDAAGRITLQEGADGFTQYYYDLAGNTTRTEKRGASENGDSLRRTTELVYDLLDNVIAKREPEFEAVTWHSENINETTSLQTPKTVYEYDRWGNVTKHTDAIGKSTEYAFNHDDNLIKETSAQVSAWSESLDEISTQVVKESNYTLTGAIAQETHSTTSSSLSTSKSSYNLYDDIGQLRAKVDYAYNGETHKNRIEYIYDIHGNKVGTRRADGRVVVDDFDAMGQHVKQSVVRKGNGSINTTSAMYNSYTDQGSTTMLVKWLEYAYDGAGRVSQELNNKDHALSYKYDSRGLMIQSRNRVGGDILNTYDQLGKKTNERAILEYTVNVSEQRDSYGNVTRPASSTDYIDETYEKNWTYHYGDFEVGRIDTMAVGSGLSSDTTYRYEYNGFGQLYREVDTSNSGIYIQNDYYKNGLLKRKDEIEQFQRTSSLPSNPRDGDRVTLYSHNSNAAIFKYDIRGLKTSEENVVDKNSNGEEWTHDQYDSYGQPVGSGYWDDWNTSYDSSLKTLYHYDELGRLDKVQSPGSYLNSEIEVLEYRYDEWGNRRQIHAEYQRPNSSTTLTKDQYFLYDAQGRTLTKTEKLTNGEIVVSLGTYGGTQYAYDDMGRLKSEESHHGDWEEQVTNPNNGYGTITQDVAEKWAIKRYTYNDRDLVERHTRQFVRREYNQTIESGPSEYETAWLQQHWDYDERGFQTFTSAGGINTTSYYRADGRMSSETIKKSNGDNVSLRDNYKYDGFGNVKAYRAINYSSTGSTTYNYAYSYVTTYSGKQIGTITVNATGERLAPGKTRNYYDRRGRLVTASIGELTSDNKNATRTKTFSYNGQGMMIGSTDRLSTQSNTTRKVFYYHKGAQLASTTNGTLNITAQNTIYEAGATPSTYTVNAGDSLSTIANALFGDASLWYVIAEANGLNMGPSDQFSESDIGRALNIPNTKQALRNDSNSFKPFNAGEIIGDLTPDPYLLPPPPPPKKSCNMIAAVVMVVVAIVAAAVIGPAVAAFMGPALGSTGAAMAGAFVGGVAGSLASQAVGNVLGVVDGIDFKQALVSGVTAAATAGLGEALNGVTYGKDLGKINDAINGAIKGAASVAVNAAANRIAGLDSNFSWAAAAAGAMAGGLTGGMGLDASIDEGSFSMENFANSFATSFTSGVISSGASRLMGETDDIDWGAIALDAFGNAVGESVKSHFSLESKSEKFGAEMREKYDAWRNPVQLREVPMIDTSGLSAEIEAKTLAHADAATQETIDRLSAEQDAKRQRATEAKIEANRQADQEKFLQRQSDHVKALEEVGQKTDGLTAKSEASQEKLDQHKREIRESRLRFNAEVNKIAAANKRVNPEAVEIARRNAWREEYVAAERAATAWKKQVTIGFGETALTIGSGIFAEVAGGWGMILSGGDVEYGNRVRDMLTYTPKTEGGRHVLKTVGEAMAPIAAVMEYASQSSGDFAYKHTGSEALAAAFYTLPEAAALLLAPEARTATVAATKATAKAAKDIPIAIVNEVLSGPTPGSMRSQRGSIDLSDGANKVFSYNLVDQIGRGKTLLLGEGNLSFSKSLLGNNKINSKNITATTYEPRSALASDTVGNKVLLEDNGMRVMHGVDATDIAGTLGKDKFDTISFNFPHTGQRPSQPSNKALLRGFFSSAQSNLLPGGKVVVTLKDTPHYKGWRIEEQANFAGLKLVNTNKFNFDDFPGFNHTQTKKHGTSAQFSNGAVTYTFEVAD